MALLNDRDIDHDAPEWDSRVGSVTVRVQKTTHPEGAHAYWGELSDLKGNLLAAEYGSSVDSLAARLFAYADTLGLTEVEGEGTAGDTLGLTDGV